MPFSSAALATELQTDPKGLGYAALIGAGNDAGLASLLNSLTGGGTGTITRNDVQPKEIIQSIAPADFSAATALTVSKLQLFLSIGILDVTLPNVQANLQGIFSAASAATKNALVAVCTRTGSRAEVLFGQGVSVGISDISAALGRAG